MASATTYNGNPSYATIGKPHLDFFGGATRHTLDYELILLAQKCLKDDPQLALLAFFQKRDCREGTGERKPFILAFQQLPQSLRFLLYPILPNYGYWDDLNALARAIPEDRQFIAEFFAERIKDNMMGFTYGVVHKNLEKWLPTEGQQDDNEWKAVNLIVKAFHVDEAIELRAPIQKKLQQLLRTAVQKLDPEAQVKFEEPDVAFKSNKDGVRALVEKWVHISGKANSLPKMAHCLKKSGYRKWCSFMRAFTDVTEHYMTEGLEMVEYSKVSSISFNRNKEHFEAHDKERFEAFIEKVKGGEAKINVARLMPYQLVEQPSSEVRDEQWKLMVGETRGIFSKMDQENPFHPRNSVHVADVSGSMTHRGKPQPLHVALSMAILMAEVGERPLYTFSDVPTKHFPTWKTLTEALEEVKNPHMNTDLKALLNEIHAEGVSTPSARPKSIFIYTDGGFNQMCRLEPTTASDYIKNKFFDWPQAPIVIFWNVAGNIKDFAATTGHTQIVQLSGFSKDLYKSLLHLTSLTELNTDRFFREAVLIPRYDLIKDLFQAWQKEHPQHQWVQEQAVEIVEHVFVELVVRNDEDSTSDKND